MNQNTFKKYLPHIAVVLTLIYFGFQMRPRSDAAGEFSFRDFGRIPVISDGRHKPLDTVARTKLMIITHRQAYYDSETSKSYPATKWLLDVLITPPPSGDDPLEDLFENGAEKRPAWLQKVFRIENDELIRFLSLKPRDGLRYSFAEIAQDRKQFAAFLKEVHRVRSGDPKKLNLFDSKVLELSEHLHAHVQLSAHTVPLVVPNPAGTDQWKSFRETVDQFPPGEPLPASADAAAFSVYRDLLVSYDQGDKVGFNRLVRQYLDQLKSQGKLGKTDLEVFFNEFAPFYHCLALYVLIALAGSMSWLTQEWSQPIRRAAYASMATVFVFHLFGLFLRMYLQDRMFVFVTNLYSSAVFIGLGCVLFCLIAEWFFRNGIAIVVGSVTGFCTLIIAHILSLDGDTMIMMQAVLDTNFWLATHVTCVTLGYTAAFVAGFMGIAYIFLGIFTDMLRKEGSANLTRMTYGVLCAGMFLSFVGTVLGGLWADYSWGRFWGWDPKENGALLIVLWIALILHARWGGMVKHRGIAVLSVLGIIITSWSWFGTNFLGVGLHAYGGAKAQAMMMLILIDLGFLAIALAGALTPLEMWQSFRPAMPPSSSGKSAGKAQPSMV